MTPWASNANYSGLTGLSAAYNGTPTKVAPADYANGFVPHLALTAQEWNYLITEIQADLATAVAAAVPSSRLVSAGNGLTGGGSLAADRSYAVQANGASIVVGAGGVKVGVIDSTMHGARGGGSLHPDATNAAAGFATAVQIQVLELLAAADAATPYSAIETTVTGTQNNFNPSGWDAADLLICNNASSITFTGFAAPTGANSKWVKRIVATNATVSLSLGSGSSSAANQVQGSGSFDQLVTDYSALTIAYARGAASPRWYVVGQSGVSA